jgi:ATP-binding cassette subfamily B protein
MTEKSLNIKYPEVRLKDVAVYLWRGIAGSRLAMAFALVGVAAASAFEIIAPLYYKRFFDLLSSGQDKNILAPQLIHLLFIILTIAGASWLCWRLGSIAGVAFQAKAMANLRRQAYNHLIHHSYSFFTNNFAGALVQRVGRYARSFERFTDRIIWSLIPLLVRLAGIVIVTMTIESRLTLLILCWALIYMATNYFYSLWKLKYNLKAAEADSQTTAVLADTIANQNNIDIFSRHAKEKNNFSEVTENQKKIVAFNWNIDLGLDAIQSAFIIFIEFAIFYLAIRYWQIGALTLGTFVLVQMYVLGLGGRLWEFSRIIRDFYSSYADTKEMVEIMKLPYEITTSLDAQPLSVPAGEVIFDNVSFAFSDAANREVLKNINIKVAAGEKVALVGPSGSGKTTLVRLLLRLYDVVSGRILIDNQEIKNVTLESLRSNISLVPQDPILFHRTIMENIRYGKEGAGA